MTGSAAEAVFSVAHAFAGAVFAMLLVVAARHRPRTPYLRAWMAVCVAGAVYSFLGPVIGQLATPALAPAAIRAAMTAGCLAMYCFLLFAITFAGLGKGTRVIVAVGGAWLTILLALFWLTDLVISGVTESDFARFAPVAGPLMPVYMGYVTAAWILSLVYFVRTLRSSSGLRRIQAAYMLVAFGIGAVATSATLLPSLLESQTLLAVSPAFLFPLFPLTITYAIVRHRLWDVRTIAHRTAVWLALSLLLLVPIYLVVRAAAELLPAMGHGERAVLLVVLFLLAHLYLRSVQPRLDHVFQRRAYDRRMMRERFADGMAQIGRPQEVAHELLDTFSETLYPERVEVLFAGNGEGGWRRARLAGGDISSDTAEAVETTNAFLASLVDVTRAVEVQEIDADSSLAAVRQEATLYFEENDCQVCLPLVRGGELLGVVHLGPKKNLRPYSRGDLEFLEQIGTEASIGLSNALLFERVDAQRRDLEDLTANLEMRVTDRTRELEETNLKLEEANEELKELDRAKSRFFANISHELRTPLTLILAPLDSMLDGELGDFDDQQVHHLSSIKRNSIRLLKLIDDLLDLSRLEDSRLRLQLGHFEVIPFAARIVDTAATMAERKGVEVELEARAEPELEGDEEKLEAVLVNLLSNALKFTGRGGSIRIVVDAVEEKASIAVSDTGAGIPDQELPNVFDRFYQVDSSITRSHGGAGIGLALAKELVELHGGSISVTSIEGEGSTFTVELPFDAGAVPEENIERRRERTPVAERRRESDAGIPEWAEAMTSAEEYRFLDLASATERRLVPRERVGGLEAPRILVVEDNPDMLRYLHQVLAESYEVWPVQEGERAWELLLREHHDLVVTDVAMPGLSGIQLCDRIKGDERTSSVPVVFLTARGRTEHRIEGHAVGADAFLAKPFSPAELRAAIDRLIEERAKSDLTAARRRTASMETLIAGMAHELRNAAHQVQSAHRAICELVRDETGEEASPSPRVEALERVSRKAVERITAVVEALRQYSLGAKTAKWQECPLDALVTTQAALLSGATPSNGSKGATLLVEARSGATVRGPMEQLRQMVINLVDNAMHAAGDGGTVKVTAAAAGDHAIVRVEDDGEGMTPEVADQAFEPFFTTKGPDEGSGLGLALVSRTVRDVGGDVRLQSRRGVGTEVVVELPVCGAGGAATPSNRSEA